MNVLEGRASRAANADASPTAQALGGRWADLPEVVRRLHGPCAARGPFEVEAGRSWPARMLARVFGLPGSGSAVDTRLEVTAGSGQYIWIRRFAGRRLATRQRVLASGTIAERLGPIECLFTLEATDDGIEYRQTGARLCAGPLRMRIPKRLRPHVEARACAQGAAMAVEVTVHAPLAGRLLRYRGTVREEGP